MVVNSTDFFNLFILMNKNIFLKGELYINYLGPFSALLGNLIATPILISNLGIKEWSLFALINILLPLVSLVLAGKGFLMGRLMINIFLGNEKSKKSIDMFYKHEQKIFTRFIISIICLSICLFLLNSNNHSSFEKIGLTFFLISIAVFIKIFEHFYAHLLNGLKEHYKLQISGIIVTISKWVVIIYLSLQNDIKINTLIISVIIFSLFLIVTQRFFICNYFRKKKNNLTNLNKNLILGVDDKNFDIVIFLLILLLQFYNVLIFGILDPIKISYFGIALMISTGIPLIYSPLIAYLTPEINEKGEIRSRDRIKYFSNLIIIQFIVLSIILFFANLFLGQILNLWIGNSLNLEDISNFLIPLSISVLAKELLDTLKTLYVAENKIIYMKNPLLLVFFIFIFLIISVYLQAISPQVYLYCGSIMIFILALYFYFVFFKKIN